MKKTKYVYILNFFKDLVWRFVIKKSFQKTAVWKPLELRDASSEYANLFVPKSTSLLKSYVHETANFERLRAWNGLVVRNTNQWIEKHMNRGVLLLCSKQLKYAVAGEDVAIEDATTNTWEPRTWQNTFSFR